MWSYSSFITMDVLGLTIVAVTPIAVSCNLRPLLSLQCSTPCCASLQTTNSGLWERYSVVSLSKASIAKTLLGCFPPPLFNGYTLKLVVPNGVVVSPALNVRRLLLGHWFGVPASDLVWPRKRLISLRVLELLHIPQSVSAASCITHSRNLSMHCCSKIHRWYCASIDSVIFLCCLS